jgi:hypothetical protein
MKKSIGIAAFLATSAGAVGAAAFNLFGSDDLRDFTLDVVAQCPAAASITHPGCGSGRGEQAMVAGNQGVAPMSRMMAGSVSHLADGGLLVTGVCQGVNGSDILADGGYNTAAAASANGLVVGLGAVGVVSSPGNCTGAQGGSGCPPANPAVGLAGAGATVTPPGSATYTFSDWRDVLRVLFMGKDHCGAVNCNSALRNFLANNYGSVFAAGPNCNPMIELDGGADGGAISCTAIRHLYRLSDAVPDEFPDGYHGSPATDIFSELLGFSAPSARGGAAASEPAPAGSILDAGADAEAGAGADAGEYHFGSDNFCNTTTTVALGGSANAPWNSTIPGENPGAENAPHGIVHNDAQDHDPIRRLCAGSGGSAVTPGDNVCERATPATVAATANATVSSGQITNVTVNTGGSGYLSPPNVNIIGGGGGNGCSLTGTVSGGAVTAIAGFPCGSGFTSAPTIDLTFYGGGGSIGESTLGLLLPLVDDSSLGTSVQYPTGTCAQTITVHAPLVPKANGVGVTGANCPNGDWSGNAAQCFVPADSNGNPNCLATSGGAVALSQNAVQGSAQGAGSSGPDPKAADGRAFNLWAWALGSDGVYHVAGDDLGVADSCSSPSRPIYGAFNRIHIRNSTVPLGATCQRADMTDQIGCLVVVEPCSFGYAGRETVLTNPGVALDWIKGEPLIPSCIEPSSSGPFFAYPMASKQYLNTISGFINDGGPEFALAQCESNTTILNSALTAHGIGGPRFLPLQLNGGSPYCEDFNESAFCNDGGTPFPNACAATINAGLTGLATTCGDGLLDVLEECDFGAPPGTADNPCPAGQSCNTICRCVGSPTCP